MKMTSVVGLVTMLHVAEKSTRVPLLRPRLKSGVESLGVAAVTQWRARHTQQRTRLDIANRSVSAASDSAAERHV